MRLSIMQPYFIPYAGYFRLFLTTDIFVVYDCVQFPRRSFIHRNKLLDATEQPAWLTLPLHHAAQNVKIKDLVFHEEVEIEFSDRLRRFPKLINWLKQHEELKNLLCRFSNHNPVNYIVGLLQYFSGMIGSRSQIFFSSSLNLSDELKGQDRILAICEYFNAKIYVNSPGGVALYDPVHFSKRGIQLKFLEPFIGEYLSILQLLLETDITTISQVIHAQCQLREL